MSPSFKPYTLSQLAAEIAGVMREHFEGRRQWVVAEITSLKVVRGHCYLTLTEKEEVLASPKAEFRAMIWADKFTWMHARFQKESGTVLHEQMQVMMLVEVSYHERYGLSLQVHDIDSSYSLGQIEAQKRRTLQRLSEENLIDRNRNMVRALVLQRIAVISSNDSKGYEDFITRLNDPSSPYSFDVRLYPSLMQGDYAASEIVVQLNQIALDHRQHPYDAVMLLRGGGGSSSLECYNDYRLAREIALMPLPVFTGIGHTSDRSVCDAVAQVSLLTPTDAAVFLLDQMRDFERGLEEQLNQLTESASGLIETEWLGLQQSQTAIVQLLQNRIMQEKMLISAAGTRVITSVRDGLRQASDYLMVLPSRLRYLAEIRKREEESQLRDRKLDISLLVVRSLHTKQHELDLAEQRVTLLDPARILARGFSYTLHRGAILRDLNQLNPGDVIETVVSNGKVNSTVNSIENGRT